MLIITYLRSGQVSVYGAHSEQAVVAHACHGHRYRSSPVPLSRPGYISKLLGLYIEMMVFHEYRKTD